MDEAEQAKAYAQADFSVAHESFVDFFEAVFKGLPVGHVLDLGCGSGDVSCRFARRFPKVRLDGIDGSEVMLHWGYKAVAERQLEQRVRLHHGYLPGADFPRRDYDIVISNSLLHHLADPAVLWRLLPMVGRPGARVFVMDLVRPATLEEARPDCSRFIPVRSRQFCSATSSTRCWQPTPPGKWRSSSARQALSGSRFARSAIATRLSLADYRSWPTEANCRSVSPPVKMVPSPSWLLLLGDYREKARCTDRRFLRRRVASSDRSFH